MQNKQKKKKKKQGKLGGEAEVERTWRFALRDVKARATFYSQIVYRVSLCTAVKQSAEGFLLLLFYTERADYNAEIQHCHVV